MKDKTSKTTDTVISGGNENSSNVNPADRASSCRKLCVCIADKDPDKCLQKLSKYAMAELRADLCNLSMPQLQKILSVKKDFIFTFRISDNNMSTALNQTLEAIGQGVAYVDVDIDSPAPFLRIIKEALGDAPAKTKLILSSHPESVPSLNTLQGIVRKCRLKGADIVKIVPFAKNLEEASRVLRLYHTMRMPDLKKNLIAFASGTAGFFTRISCLSLGAPFTYCHDSQPLAKGQPSYEELYESIYGKAGAEPYRIGDMKDSLLLSRFCQKLPDAKRNTKEKNVSVPCSKSVVLRALFVAALSNGQSVLRNFEFSNDIRKAVLFLRKCGCVVNVTRDGRSSRGEFMVIVRSAGISKWKVFKFADAGESGLLARILLPISAYASSIRRNYLVSSQTCVTGEGSLLKRDLSDAVEGLRAAGIKCKGQKVGKEVYLPVHITKASFKKSFTISGKQSSQLISGMLIILPLLPQRTQMVVEDAVSIPYINMTVKIMRTFGINIDVKQEGRTLIFETEGNQEYKPSDMYLESDWSGASNFMVAGAVACGISRKHEENEGLTIKRMSPDSEQADKAILNVLESCGVKIKYNMPENRDFAIISRYDLFNDEGNFLANLRNISLNANVLKAFSFDATDCPDLFPILAVLAVFCNGESRINGISRLTNKESNRTVSILQEMTRLGYDIFVEGNELVVKGRAGKAIDVALDEGSPEKLLCSSHNDHRIAMAVIICALLRGHGGNNPLDVYLDDIGCIDKSFPSFVRRLKMQKITSE
mgnify:FL=1